MAKTTRSIPSLSDYIQAGYPCLFLRTVETQAAEKDVRRALSEMNMGDTGFGVWKATSGLKVGKADGTETPTDRCTDLLDALAFVETSETPLVVCFHNTRQFVNNYSIIQQLIDAIWAARTKGSHIILIGPHLELPAELKNLVTYVDKALPTQDELKKNFKKIVTAYEDKLDLPKGKDAMNLLLTDAARAAIGLDEMGAENAIALSLAKSESVDLELIQAQKEQEVRKSDVLEYVGAREAMNEVGGFHAMKEWLERRSTVFSSKARAYGLPYPKGMLIVGPAGTGKSLVAKAVSTYLKLPLLRLDMGKVFRSLVGESEAAIRMALQVVEAVSPVVLWMDEIDKGLAGMRGSGDLDSGVTSRVVSTILTWRQETTYPVMLVGTANDVASIPSMVYRKGRLTQKVWPTINALNCWNVLKLDLLQRGWKRRARMLEKSSDVTMENQQRSTCLASDRKIGECSETKQGVLSLDSIGLMFYNLMKSSTYRIKEIVDVVTKVRLLPKLWYQNNSTHGLWAV